MAQQYPQLGEKVTQLVRSLVAVKGWSMTYAMGYIGGRTGYSPDMIHRWRRGRSCPPHETVEMLARIGKEEANLGYEWGESFLKAARYPDIIMVTNNLWGPKEFHPIPQNLPPLKHTDLIGRQAEVAHLLDILSPQKAAHLITVDGIGGVGKTALVLEVAYLCWKASIGEAFYPGVPAFEAIIFVSAKQEYLTPAGILPRLDAQSTLRDICREVALTLNRIDIVHAAPPDQRATMREALTRQRTLLLVDNLETMEDRQEIMSFLFELPLPVKVVITTREQALFSPIRLEQLLEEKALELIQKEAYEKKAHVSDEDARKLYQHIGGIPAALVYAIGQIASGYSTETVLGQVPKAGGDVARFCFEGSIGPLRGQHAHHLLMATAMFPKHPLRAAIAHTAGLATDLTAAEVGLVQLQHLSLMSQQGGRYGMLSLTREYALAELTAQPEFERKARKRWVEWYINFAKEYGGDDWKEWHIQFDRIEEEWENLLSVFDWCAAHELYDEMRNFWQGGRVLHFASIYGYWHDRLSCLYWLIQAAERRGDWPTAMEAMTDKGYILILMGQLEEADRLLIRAWSLHKYANQRAQVEVAQNIGRLRTYQKQYTDASYWFDQARDLLDTTQLDEPERTRRQIATLHYQGDMHFKQQHYDQAEILFREMLDLAQAVGWHRAIIYAQNWLANIAILQNRLDEAELLLQNGLIVSERNKDKRRVAHYKSSFAYLQQKRGNLDEARRLAKDAKDSFERLGMRREIEEMDNLLQQLQV